MKGRVRKHLEEYNRKIHLNTTYVQHPLHENDVLIMHLVNTQTIKKVNINLTEKINYVRMFLGVCYVRQTCTVDGTSFSQGMLKGDNNQLVYLTTLTKPDQGKPENHIWMLWKEILKILTLTPSTKTTTRRLTNRLGT